MRFTPNSKSSQDGKTILGYCSRIDQTPYNDRYNKGDGWNLATPKHLASLKAERDAAMDGTALDHRYEYLFEVLQGSSTWIRSPPSTVLWDWSRWQVVPGRYWHRNDDNDDGSGLRGEFDCNTDGRDREPGVFGAGCSTAGAGTTWKAMPTGAFLNESAAAFTLCTNASAASACLNATVKVRRAGRSISAGTHKISVRYMGAAAGFGAGDPYLGGSNTIRATWDVQEMRNKQGRVWGQLTKRGTPPTKRTVKAIAGHHDTTRKGKIQSHTFTFFKERDGVNDDHPIRIAWFDNFGTTYGLGNPHVRWEVRIDGQQCDTRAPAGTKGMRVDMWHNFGSSGRAFFGIEAINLCHNIPRGEHTIEIFEVSPSDWKGTPTLGWSLNYDSIGRGTTALIEVEEIGAFLNFDEDITQPAKLVRGVLSFGRPGSADFVKTFTVKYMDVMRTWHSVDNGRIFTRSQTEALPTVAEAKAAQTSVDPVRNDFFAPVSARALRIYPHTWNNHPSGSFALLVEQAVGFDEIEFVHQHRTSGGCKACPRGWYNDDAARENATLHFHCKACAKGKYAEAGSGIVESNHCLGCAAGRFSSDGVAQSDVRTCGECPSGFFTKGGSEKVGHFDCAGCPNGYYGVDVAQSSCFKW
jgi:hypothetical protein